MGEIPTEVNGCAIQKEFSGNSLGLNLNNLLSLFPVFCILIMKNPTRIVKMTPSQPPPNPAMKLEIL